MERPNVASLRALTGLLTLASVACAEERLHLDWPMVPGSSSALVVRQRADSIEGVAFDLADPIRLEVEPLDRVTILSFTPSLDSLGLAPGTVELGLPGGDCAWLAPERVHVLAVSAEGDEARWVEAEGLGDDARTLIAPDWTQRCATCRGFTRREVEIDLGTTGRVAIEGTVELPDGRALVLATDSVTESRLFVVDMEAAQPVTGCASLSGPIAFVGDGRLVIGQYHTVQLADLDLQTLTCTVTETISFAPIPIASRWLAGHEPGESFELFVLDRAGDLHHFDDARTQRTVAVPANPAVNLELSGGLVRRGAGRAAAAFSGDTLLHYEDGEVRLEPVPQVGAGRIYDLGADRQGRLILGGNGRVIRESGPTWIVEETSFVNEVRRVHVYRDGLLSVVRPGTALVSGPLTGGSCPPESGRIGGSSNPELRYSFARDDAIFLADAVEWEVETTRPGRRRLVWLIPSSAAD